MSKEKNKYQKNYHFPPPEYSQEVIGPRGVRVQLDPHVFYALKMLTFRYNVSYDAITNEAIEKWFKEQIGMDASTAYSMMTTTKARELINRSYAIEERKIRVRGIRAERKVLKNAGK